MNARRAVWSVVILGICGLAQSPCACAGSGADKFEALYLRWHKALDAHPVLSEPLFFETEGVPPDLAAVVKEIKIVGIDMATFMAEKLAAPQQQDKKMRLYRDVVLLDKVSGINLVFGHPSSYNVMDNISALTSRFREDWNSGVYADPSGRLRTLCEELSRMDGISPIDARQIAPLRRYGVFGLPELIRQVKLRNSKHAFAAYLIITHQREKYAEYLGNSDKQFTSKQSKLDHMQRSCAALRSNGAEGADLAKRIAEAIAE